MKSTGKSAANPGRRRAHSWLRWWLPGVAALALGCAACKRADEGARPQTTDASTSQMSAPAGAQMAPASGPKP
ncbi:hypothetical protein [Paraburkholderia silvatlantica]|uniref:Lipoprotein n=1 Tax=Paraburkholderia silvatlantica TaxID=321895 RepID=A0ABR6FFE4_9BURK|nr:hypothetical protein [Paraburkholderia silvatlantica]MBB2926149.1 hypothetical protein [Paraburkholderia silvatlantica]PVY23388.1 hypothetical protein C7411_12924 [Paraburkholderia silvatlantica]PXW30427.1 hypothetical protein C7413_12824 [Paraburkholderia silvatlantica]